MSLLLTKMSSINVIIHFCVFFTYGYAIYWQEFHQKPIPSKNPQEAFAGKYKYLTYWNLIIQFIFFTICLFCDLLPRNQSSICKTLKKVRDYMFHGLAFPTSLFVSITFWTLYAIDRELVYSKRHEPHSPVWLNHILHTLIVPFIVLESIISYHKIPSNIVGLTILYSFVISYGLWTFYMALAIDLWVYPVLKVMNWPKRLLFIGGSALFFTLLYFIGQQLHKKFWSEKRIENSIN